MVPPLDLTLGSYLVGAILNAAIWGISCVQTYTFYTRNPGDRVFLKVLVGSLWCTNTFNLLMNIHLSYFYLITEYGNPASLIINNWSLWFHSMSAGFMEFVIRSMFTRRVYLLSNKNKPLTGFLVIASLLTLAFVEYLSAKLAMQKDLAREISKPAVMLHIVPLTLVEFSIAISLCYYLYTSRSSVKRTTSIIHTLMLYSFNTGLIVFFISIIVVILGKSFPRSSIAPVMASLITKLYFCCYLFSLNAREDFHRGNDDLASIRLSRLEFAPSIGTGVSSQSNGVFAAEIGVQDIQDDVPPLPSDVPPLPSDVPPLQSDIRNSASLRVAA